MAGPAEGVPVAFHGGGGLSWRALPQEAAWVREALAPDPAAAERLPGARVVKRNPVRTVVRVPRAGRDAVFVKLFRPPGPLGALKYLVVPSRAEAEWRASRALRAAGLPAAETLAVGEARTAGVLRASVAVVREVPDALELVPWMFKRFRGGAPFSPADEAARAELFGRLGALLRGVHDAGFRHPDLHGGNVLVGTRGEPPALTLIDLHTVKRTGAPGSGARALDLGRLLHSMLTATSPRDREALVAAYEGGRPVLRGLDRDPALTEARLAELERGRVEGRVAPAKLLRPTGRFDVARRDGLRWVFLREWGAEPFVAALAVHGRLAASGEPVGERVLKRGGRSTVTRVEVPGPRGPARLVVKETRVRGPLDVLKNALRRPRAVRSWFGGNGLWQRHFDVAEPRALAVRGRWPLRRESFIVMEDVAADGERFDLRALRLWGHGPLDAAGRAGKREDLERFGAFVGNLHARSVYHADLKAVNVFVRRRRGQASFCLVDYDRVEFLEPDPLGRDRAVKNLAQVAASVGTFVSRGDRLRWYRAYAARRPGTWDARKEIASLVAAACARKIVVRREPIE